MGTGPGPVVLFGPSWESERRSVVVHTMSSGGCAPQAMQRGRPVQGLVPCLCSPVCPCMCVCARVRAARTRGATALLTGGLTRAAPCSHTFGRGSLGFPDRLPATVCAVVCLLAVMLTLFVTCLSVFVCASACVSAWTCVGTASSSSSSSSGCRCQVPRARGRLVVRGRAW
jgi:hypothetical protein